jgi:hypothetical protein
VVQLKLPFPSLIQPVPKFDVEEAVGAIGRERGVSYNLYRLGGGKSQLNSLASQCCLEKYES